MNRTARNSTGDRLSTSVFRQLPATGTTPERSHSLTLQLSRCIAPLDPINKPDEQAVIGSVGGHQLMSKHSSATLFNSQFVTPTRDWNSPWPTSSLRVGQRRNPLILVRHRQERSAHLMHPPMLLQSGLEKSNQRWKGWSTAIHQTSSHCVHISAAPCGLRQRKTRQAMYV